MVNGCFDKQMMKHLHSTLFSYVAGWLEVQMGRVSPFSAPIKVGACMPKPQSSRVWDLSRARLVTCWIFYVGDIPFPPIQNASMGEQRPQMCEELPTISQAFDMLLHIIWWCDIEQQLGPEICQHLLTLAVFHLLELLPQLHTHLEDGHFCWFS